MGTTPLKATGDFGDGVVAEMAVHFGGFFVWVMCGGTGRDRNLYWGFLGES